ncbi:metal-dependent hydrolase [Actinomadura opuntiae]|uniref:metal-dependent hydrolase n=1 Tax=Actinomadura sp. OS1-43 TaxID=604315 RepID=UPI00255A9AC8|nr:metal-dependent hydrolase [Actinomadura sp. OS1-43]MDL4816002.1 metal-dependent hydrolase [Actinomadura sp. OS1-43]
MSTSAFRIRPRTVRARRVQFEYPEGRLPRHYMNDDLVMSHIVTVLSSVFPEGEDFFVKTVRHYRDEVTDPELKTQVAGFIGQEVTHGREHRHFNERLRGLGYPTRFIDRQTKYGLALLSRVLPPDVQLAVTAALEHYTATLAYVLLNKPEARDMFTEPEIRRMFLWHALEESEHKSVAFDVFQTVSGDQRVRRWVMNAVTVDFLLFVIGLTVVSLALDPEARRLPRLARSLRRLRTSPFLQRDVVRHLRDYNRRDFHPDDNDTTALEREWKAKLFDEQAELG